MDNELIIEEDQFLWQLIGDNDDIVHVKLNELARVYVYGTSGCQVFQYVDEFVEFILNKSLWLLGLIV